MRFPRPRALFAIGAIVLAFALASCGGGDSEPAAEKVPRLTKAQLLKKGTAICDQGNRKITAGLDPYEKKRAATGKVATQAELNYEAWRVVLPVRKIELLRLRALGMPKKDARRFKTMLASMEEGIRKGEKSHYLLLAWKRIYAFKEASEVGIRFGLVDCWLG
jgi:hypothetical protein